MKQPATKHAPEIHRLLRGPRSHRRARPARLGPWTQDPARRRHRPPDLLPRPPLEAGHRYLIPARFPPVQVRRVPTVRPRATQPSFGSMVVVTRRTRQLRGFFQLRRSNPQCALMYTREYSGKESEGNRYQADANKPEQSSDGTVAPCFRPPESRGDGSFFHKKIDDISWRWSCRR